MFGIVHDYSEDNCVITNISLGIVHDHDVQYLRNPSKFAHESESNFLDALYI